MCACVCVCVCLLAWASVWLGACAAVSVCRGVNLGLSEIVVEGVFLSLMLDFRCNEP